MWVTTVDAYLSGGNALVSVNTVALSSLHWGSYKVTLHLRHLSELRLFAFVLDREALHALSHFQSRQVRSTAWKCNLEIGSSLTIPICLYTRVFIIAHWFDYFNLVTVFVRKFNKCQKCTLNITLFSLALITCVMFMDAWLSTGKSIHCPYVCLPLLFICGG